MPTAVATDTLGNLMLSGITSESLSSGIEDRPGYFSSAPSTGTGRRSRPG